MGDLHWILIRSLEFLAPLGTLKWHQLHFLYWNFIVAAWPHFFVLRIFSLLWAASLPQCTVHEYHEKLCVCIPYSPACLSLCRAPEWWSCISSSRTKHHCWLKGREHLCQPRGFPAAQRLCAARELVCQAGSSSFLRRSRGVECVLLGWQGCGTGGTKGGQLLQAEHCETVLSGSGKGKGSGKRGKRKGCISGWETRLSPALAR